MEKKILLTALFILGILFLINLVSSPTTVGTSDMTRGRVVWIPPTPINQSTTFVDTIDTSAYVNCSTSEVFLGNGSCLDSDFFFDGGGSFTDTNASTECSDGYYLDGDSTCYHFNDSVKTLFAEEQIVYNASLINTTVGTVDSGNLASILILGDGDTYNISEVSGVPGFLIYINFSNVLNFNTVALRGRYEGGGGHTLALEIYRTGVGWEEREEITDQMDWGVTTFPVFIGSNFIDGGTVQLRINHDDNGIIAHDYFLDAVFIGQVPGLVSGGDLADLTGRNNACVLLPDVFCKDGSKNMTGNLNGSGYNTTFDYFFGDGSLLTAIPTFNASYNAHLTQSGESHTYINQPVLTSSSPTFVNPIVTNLHISSGESNELILEADTSEYSGDLTLTFDIPNANRTLTINGNSILDNWFNQDVKTTAEPTFVGLTLDFPTGNDYQILDRVGGLAWKNKLSGSGMIFEQFTNDGDGTDSNTHNIFAEGTTAGVSPGSLLQVGYNIADTSAYRIWSIHVGDGDLRNITFFTEGNTNQFLLGTGGQVYMAQAVNDALGNLRDTKWDTTTGQIGYDSSSIRYKENLKSLPSNISDKVYELDALQYDKIDGAKDRIGFTAEQVDEFFPQCVSYKTKEVWGKCGGLNITTGEDYEYDCVDHYEFEINKTTGKKIPESINYDCLITPLIQEFQNLKANEIAMDERLNIVDERLKYLEENCILK